MVEEDIGCCGTFQKWVIFFINIILFIFGIIQLSVAAYVIAGGTEGLGFALDLLGDNDSAIKSMLAFGILIVFISFWGCYGAVKENLCLLWIYTFSLFFLIIGQSMTVAVIAVSLKYGDTIFESLWKDLEPDTITDIEMAYDCCSFYGDNANETWAGDVEDYEECYADYGYSESCWGKFERNIEENYDMMKIITAVFMGFQIFIYFCAHFLMQNIAEAEGIEAEKEKMNDVEIERRKPPIV